MQTGVRAVLLQNEKCRQNDLKPLKDIMMKAPANTPPNLQRMLLRLQKYDKELIYKAGKEMILE